VAPAPAAAGRHAASPLTAAEVLDQRVGRLVRTLSEELDVSVITAPLPKTEPQGFRLRLRGKQFTRWQSILLAILAQIGLTMMMDSVRIIGLVQSVAILALGLYFAAKRNVTYVLALCGYTAGAEVLWRQVRAPTYYLMAPYTVTLLCVVTLVWTVGRFGRTARMAVLYFTLLLPGIIATVQTTGGDARELVAFALTGPMALAALVALTSQLQATDEDFRLIMWTTFISAISPLTIAILRVRETLAVAGSIQFKDQSNFITSGGFGPVQVSSVLGLGALLGLLLTIIEPDRRARLLAGIGAIAFSVQSLMTFSRGGMTATAIGVIALGLIHARNRVIRRRVTAIVLGSLALGYFVVIPWLIDFTGGAFEKRFSDTQSARTDLAVNDYRIFLDNPIFGVGPGMTKYQRLGYEICLIRADGCKDESSSHTEFTRLLSEHGTVGILAGVVLVVISFRGVRTSIRNHPFGTALIFWAIAQMFYANLRVVAVPVAFGLAFLAFERPPPEPAAEPE